MKKKFQELHKLEQQIFGNDIETNPYFLSVALCVLAFMGAWAGGASYLGSIFDFDCNYKYITFVPFMAFVIVVIIGESLLCSKNWKVVLGRMSLMVAATVVIYSLAFVGSIVVLGILTIGLFLKFMGAVFSSAVNDIGRVQAPEPEKRVEIFDSHGNKVDEGVQDSAGQIRSISNKTYRENFDGSVEET